VEAGFYCCWDETQNSLKVYLKDAAQKEDFLRFLSQVSFYLPFSVKEVQERQIFEKDYLLKWRDHFKPLEIGESLLVCPPWAAQGGKKVKVVVEPGLAFGTGGHASTQGCLIALERLVQKGDTLLDIGTGSGILAIASVKLGAAHALGIDTDLQALDNARQNVQLNQEESNVCFLEMSLERLRCGSFDLVVANLDFPTLSAGLAQFKKLNFRFLITGGILLTESFHLEAAYSKHYQLKDSFELDGWRTFIWSK
jgi:ribosomal protein L11 methyltransferase